jgi:hypothetical protein
MSFSSLFPTNIVFDAADVLICLGAALLLGLLLTVAYMFSGVYSKSLAISLVLMPAIIQSVILFVNQNFGAALAVGGIFALMNFRSAAGTAREIVAIFCAVAIGISVGMGYVVYAAILTVVLGVVMVILGLTPFGEDAGLDRVLKILIPESLDYTDVFDDAFKAYTRKYNLELVRTTNMDSLYELRYRVTLKDRRKEKAFMDALRERNGNLPITCAITMPKKDEL